MNAAFEIILCHFTKFSACGHFQKRVTKIDHGCVLLSIGIGMLEFAPLCLTIDQQIT